jgi:sugar phosphate permease
VAALAMVATLPGRTHGLGLFTEPILHSLGLDRESYGFLNLWATLLGGLFCIPAGFLIDRLGTRSILTGVMLGLGAVVIVMSQVQGNWQVPLALSLPGGTTFSVVLFFDLFLLILLTRGLGQSALSVASLSLIGRSAARRTGLAMGAYAFLTSLGFTAAFAVLRKIVLTHPEEWRPQWAGIGVSVIVCGVLSFLLVRSAFLDADPAQHETAAPSAAKESSSTLGQALGCPAFWTFSISSSFYLLVSSGITLFNESILAERGFSKEIFLNILTLGVPIGLASNLLCGWMATRWPLGRLLALTMGLLSMTLLAFPMIQEGVETQVYLYAAALAIVGGAITVSFFTVWRRGFGPAHLGKIQGAAQMLTVLFSALGPLLFASTKTRIGSYLPLFPYLGLISLGLALAAWLVGLPERKPKTGPFAGASDA